MNIIQAIQAAENGALITNDFKKPFNSFLSYFGKGIFFKYQIINGEAVFIGPIPAFSMAEILTTSWEIETRVVI